MFTPPPAGVEPGRFDTSMSDVPCRRSPGGTSTFLELAWPYLAHPRQRGAHRRVDRCSPGNCSRPRGATPTWSSPAIILHDVGWSRLSDDEQLQAFGPPPRRLDLNIYHEQQGAEIATEILRSIGYDPG